MIDRGHIVHDGSLERLRAEYATTRQITIDFDEPPTIQTHYLDPGISMLNQTGPRVRVSFDRQRFSAPEVITIMGRLGPIRDLSIEEPAIEQIIQHLYDSA